MGRGGSPKSTRRVDEVLSTPLYVHTYSVQSTVLALGDSCLLLARLRGMMGGTESYTYSFRDVSCINLQNFQARPSEARHLGHLDSK